MIAYCHSPLVLSLLPYAYVKIPFTEKERLQFIEEKRSKGNSLEEIRKNREDKKEADLKAAQQKIEANLKWIKEVEDRLNEELSVG